MPEQPFQSPPALQQIVRSGESVTGGPIHFVGKDMWVKLAGGDLPDSITVMEDVTPPHHGPPLHAHPFEEWFYILEGSFLFELAGMPFSVAVGDFVHAPSNPRQLVFSDAFARLGESDTGQPSTPPIRSATRLRSRLSKENPVAELCAKRDVEARTGAVKRVEWFIDLVPPGLIL
jgi:quercetin dioxygenase-like cupin family protein